MSHVYSPEFQRLFCLQFVVGNRGSDSSHHTAVNHGETFSDGQTLHAETNINVKTHGQTEYNAETNCQAIGQTVCGPI